MKKLFYTFLFVFSGFFLFAQNADAIVGTYVNPNGQSHLEYFKSGDTYSGKIVWLSEPNDASGNPRKDVKNPDKSLRNRPVMGLVTVTGLKFDGKDTYTDGRAYRVAEGDEVKMKIKINKDGSLDVTGSKGPFSKTQTWKKL